MNCKEKKKDQLGMNPSTATARLKKELMFSMVQKLGMDICFQCGEKIKSADELSVEHKIPWLDSEDPKGLFFDLDNISFSHLNCNIKAARRNTPIIEVIEGTQECRICKEWKLLDEFGKSSERLGGKNSICKICNRKKAAKHRKLKQKKYT